MRPPSASEHTAKPSGKLGFVGGTKSANSKKYFSNLQHSTLSSLFAVYNPSVEVDSDCRAHAHAHR